MFWVSLWLLDSFLRGLVWHDVHCKMHQRLWRGCPNLSQHKHCCRWSFSFDGFYFLILAKGFCRQDHPISSDTFSLMSFMLLNRMFQRVLRWSGLLKTKSGWRAGNLRECWNKVVKVHHCRCQGGCKHFLGISVYGDVKKCIATHYTVTILQ